MAQQTQVADNGAPVTTRSDRRRALFGAGIGSTLEWYDWTIYAVFAPFFASQFFNSTDPTSSMLATLAIFAVGFFMRPVGGILFGWLGDRLGRRFALTTAMSLVAGGSILIGVAPTYAAIGVGASLLLLLGRLVQGLAHGGEVASSYTYLAEMAPARKRGLWSSSLYVFVSLGIVGATVLGAVLTTVTTPDDMKSWGWRIPFLIGGVLGLYALWLRRNLAETTQFKNAHQGEAAGHKESLARGIWQNRRSVLRLGGLQIGGSVTYYTWAVAAPAYAISVKKVDATSALLASVAANVVFMIALVLTGALSDRIGRRPNFLIYSIGFTLLAFPLNALLGSSAWTLFLSMSIALILLAFATSIVPAFFAELLPSSVRTTGIGIPVSIAAALFGGTAPYLQTWFASIGNSNLFIVYMIVTVVIGLIAALLCPETKGKELK